MDFAEGVVYHNPPFFGESEIQHNDYKCNAGGQKKRERDLLPMGRGSIL